MPDDGPSLPTSHARIRRQAAWRVYEALSGDQRELLSRGSRSSQ